MVVRGCYSLGGLIMQDYGGTFQWRPVGDLFQAGRDILVAAVGFFLGKNATPFHLFIGRISREQGA